jgi:hypothetical protein
MAEGSSIYNSPAHFVPATPVLCRGILGYADAEVPEVASFPSTPATVNELRECTKET